MNSRSTLHLWTGFGDWPASTDGKQCAAWPGLSGLQQHLAGLGALNRLTAPRSTSLPPALMVSWKPALLLDQAQAQARSAPGVGSFQHCPAPAPAPHRAQLLCTVSWIPAFAGKTVLAGLPNPVPM